MSIADRNLPRRVEKPWGYELIFAHTDKYAGKVLFVKQGARLSFQYHSQKDETLHIYDGELLLHVENTNGEKASITLKKGEGYRIEPFLRHRMEAVTDTYIFEVSTPELDDVTRLQDDYGREGQTAP